MDMRQLRYFVQIVESGSLAKASRQLFIAQPALSQQMARLEDEVGKPLLLRSSRGVTPTENGSALYHHAKFMLRQLDQALYGYTFEDREAAALVQDGDALIIHGGSTCYLFALLLANRNVRIYTNSMPLAATLWQNGTCHLSLAGGELYREPGIVFSQQAGPPEFYASKFFLGAQAITPASARPPCQWPTIDDANAIIRRATPPWVRKLPARMKNGIAMISKRSMPVNSFSATDSIAPGSG